MPEGTVAESKNREMGDEDSESSELYDFEQEKQRAALERHYDERGQIARGHQIRSYVFMPYQIGEGTCAPTTRPSKIDSGHGRRRSTPFIKAYLDWKATNKDDTHPGAINSGEDGVSKILVVDDEKACRRVAQVPARERRLSNGVITAYNGTRRPRSSPARTSGTPFSSTSVMPEMDGYTSSDPAARRPQDESDPDHHSHRQRPAPGRVRDVVQRPRLHRETVRSEKTLAPEDSGIALKPKAERGRAPVPLQSNVDHSNAPVSGEIRVPDCSSNSSSRGAAKKEKSPGPRGGRRRTAIASSVLLHDAGRTFTQPSTPESSEEPGRRASRWTLIRKTLQLKQAAS